MTAPNKPEQQKFTIRKVAVQPVLEFHDAEGKLERDGPTQQTILIYEADPVFPLVMQVLEAKGLQVAPEPEPVEDE